MEWLLVIMWAPLLVGGVAAALSILWLLLAIIDQIFDFLSRGKKCPKCGDYDTKYGCWNVGWNHELQQANGRYCQMCMTCKHQFD